MKQLQKRSSYLSSLITGLVGWIGFIIVGALAFGLNIPIYTLILAGAILAVVQVVFLKSLFNTLRMHKHVAIGAFWGLFTSIPLYYALAYVNPEFASNSWSWIFIFSYIGAPVGAFLSYFYIDDLKVQKSFHLQENVNYGRDAHWLEPFVFGVVAYLIAFLPNRLDVAIVVVVVGAMSGVFAAGISHFTPDRFKFSKLHFTRLVVIMGVAQGVLTGYLFRSFAADLMTHPLMHGVIGGTLTYLATLIRGKQLAQIEMEATS